MNRQTVSFRGKIESSLKALTEMLCMLQLTEYLIR